MTAVLPWSREDAEDMLGLVVPPGQSSVLVEQSAFWAVPVINQPGWPFK